MSNNIHKIYTGSKFYKYIEDTPEIIRIRNIDYDKKIVKYFDSEGNKQKASYDTITKEYKMLSPDGLVSFSSVQVNENPDVIIALKAFPKSEKEWESMDHLPYAICRQMAADIFTNNYDPDNLILGVSISKDTCPANIDFNLMLACTGLNYTRMVAVYLDDTLDSILNLFNNAVFDKVFVELYEKYYNIKGSCTCLYELLRDNHFMYDFRKCFNILEVPFSIDEESEGLNEQNIAFLEKELKVNILETYVVRYSKEIDLTKIKRDYVLVSSAQDNFDKVYIAGYDKV